MTTIWKYPIEVVQEQVLQIPQAGRILAVQPQGAGVLCLWAKVNPDLPNEPRIIQIFGTGHQIPSSSKEYIGTVQQGPLVWHVFESFKPLADTERRVE